MVTATAPEARRARFRGPRQTLGGSFDPRNNSLNAMRLGLATAVLVSHGIKFNGSEDDPLGRLAGDARLSGTGVDIGTIAVDGFFVLSGFLITASFLTSSSWKRFMWHRFLRIFPAFWVCLLVTAAVFAPLAALLENGSATAFPVVGSESAASYVVNNAALRLRQEGIGDLLNGQFNGSLHTLFFEFLCYLGLAVLGVLGILRRRTMLVLACAALVWAAAAIDLTTGGVLTGGGDHDSRELLLRFVLMFLAGAACQRYAAHVPVGAASLLLGLPLLVASIVWVDLYLLLAPLALAVLLLPLGARPELSRVGRRRDLSYGLYVYAWPVQALLLAASVPEDTGLLPYLLLSLVLALGLAVLSWYGIEARALSAKSWSPRRRAENLSQPAATGSRRQP